MVWVDSYWVGNVWADVPAGTWVDRKSLRAGIFPRAVANASSTALLMGSTIPGLLVPVSVLPLLLDSWSIRHSASSTLVVMKHESQDDEILSSLSNMVQLCVLCTSNCMMSIGHAT